MVHLSLCSNINFLSTSCVGPIPLYLLFGGVYVLSFDRFLPVTFIFHKGMVVFFL